MADSVNERAIGCIVLGASATFGLGGVYLTLGFPLLRYFNCTTQVGNRPTLFHSSKHFPNVLYVLSEAPRIGVICRTNRLASDFVATYHVGSYHTLRYADVELLCISLLAVIIAWGGRQRFKHS